MGVCSVILGILALVAAVVATALFGTTGAIITGVIAVIAVVLGVLKRKKDGHGGISGIVISVLAIILAFAMASFWSTAFKTLHEKALEFMPDGLWAQVSEDTNGGLMGIVNKLPKDEATLNALVDELNELNKLNGTAPAEASK